MSNPQPAGGVRIRKFPGLISAGDEHDIEPGAMIQQENVWARKEGRMEGRKGMREVEMD